MCAPTLHGYLSPVQYPNDIHRRLEAMSFFSWMRGTGQRPGDPAVTAQRHATAIASLPGDVKHEPTYLRMEPSAIADEVFYLSSEHARASELCAEAKVVLNGHEYDLGRLREKHPPGILEPESTNGQQEPPFWDHPVDRVDEPEVSPIISSITHLEAGTKKSARPCRTRYSRLE